jgi:hypothetical protein
VKQHQHNLSNDLISDGSRTSTQIQKSVVNFLDFCHDYAYLILFLRSAVEYRVNVLAIYYLIGDSCVLCLYLLMIKKHDVASFVVSQKGQHKNGIEDKLNNSQ